MLSDRAWEMLPRSSCSAKNMKQTKEQMRRSSCVGLRQVVPMLMLIFFTRTLRTNFFSSFGSHSKVGS